MDPAAGPRHPPSRSRADSGSLRYRARGRLRPRSPGRCPFPAGGVPVDWPNGPADRMSAGFPPRRRRPNEAGEMLAHRIGRERIERGARARWRNGLPPPALMRLALTRLALTRLALM